MRRAGRIIARTLLWLLIIAIGLPVVLVGAVFVLLNTDLGRRQVETRLPGLTGGMVTISGLSGRFPDALRVAHIGIRDVHGAWLSIDDAALDWSPTALVGRVLRIDRLSAARIDVARLPAPSASSPASGSSSGGGFSLPVQVDLRTLSVARLMVGAPVAGHPATVAVEGHAHVVTLQDLTAHLALTRLDGPGTYTLDAGLDGTHVDAHAVVHEPPGGLIGGVAGLTSIGAVDADAQARGPMDAIAARLQLAAGPLRASAHGTVDVTHSTLDVTLDAHAPAMTPAPGIGWQSVAIDATAKGGFTTPHADGTVAIDGLTAPGTKIAAIAAKISGDAGHVALDATLRGLSIPGPKPDLFAAAPVAIIATAELKPAEKPVTLHITHPLLDATATGTVGQVIDAALTLKVPDLAPLAAIGGVDLKGRTTLTLTAHRAGSVTAATLAGTIGIDGGMAPVPALIGPAAHIDAAATLDGSKVTLDHLKLDGRTIGVAASGQYLGDAVDAAYGVTLADLSVLAPSIAGNIAVNGDARGTLDDLAADAHATGEVTAKGVRSGKLTLDARATGLPGRPDADVTARGALDGSPVDLHLAAARAADGALHLSLDRLAWKSLGGKATLDLPAGATLPLGTVRLGFARLDDLRPLLGMPLAGSVDVALDLTRDAAKAKVTARNAGLAGRASVGAADVTATVQDPLGRAVVDAVATADSIHAGALGGRARVTVRGPKSALAVAADAALRNLAGADATVATALVLDATAKDARVSALTATWKGETARLLAPVRIGFANAVTVDRLRVGVQQAVLDLAGRLSPTLDLTARLSNVTPALAAPFAPGVKADGVVNADARITGTPARPTGTVRVDATGLRLRNGQAAAIPPASLHATATLAGTSVRLDARAEAGPRVSLTVAGTAPVGAGPIDLHARGRVDLAVLDPVLTAAGERARGIVTLDAGVGGTVAHPQPTGSVTLADGDVQDYVLGARLSAINAQLDAVGETVRLTRLTARAGPGTVEAHGSVGVTGDMPIDLKLAMRRARPLASDRLTVNLDSDLTVQGAIATGLAVAGDVRITRADIRIPDKLPTSVATLKVINARQPPVAPPPPKKAPDIGLNLTLSAREVFVRGRGLDVELGGKMRLKGTAANPIPSGGFDMRRGSLSLAGQTLTFTKGDVTFNGAGIADPALDFVSTTTNGTTVATLTVGGTANNPKITLSSVPELPQDEILAQILFHRSASQLSPLELAEAAAALASFSGVAGTGDPLDRVRSALGLDRLDVGSDANGSAQITAGRYVARGVFVGAKQTASGGTQADVQIDLYKGLKLEGLAGTGGGTATGTNAAGLSSSTGSGVGLTYQFEY